MLSLQNIRDAVRKITGEDSTDLPDPDLDLLINRSFWEVQDKFPFRTKEKTVTFVTVPHSALYAVPANFDAVRSLSIEDTNTFEHSPLAQMDIHVYESSYQNQTYAETVPTNYVRESNYLRLWPTPDAAYTVVLKYNAVLADIVNGSDYPPLPQIWGEIIQFGAAWRRFHELGDYQRMNANIQLQRTTIAGIQPQEAKDKSDNRMAGLQVVGRGDNYCY